MNLRTLNVLEACAQVSRVTLVAPRPAIPSGADRLGSLCERIVLVDPPGRLASPLELIRGTSRHRSLTGRRTLSCVRPYAEAVRGLDLAGFELVWAGQPWLALVAAQLRRRTVVDLVDVEHLKAARQTLARGQQRPLTTALQAMRLWWIEVVGVRRYRACVVSSDPERRYLERWRLTNVVTVPNAIEVPDFIARRRTDPALPCRLVFVGNMAYGPNVDAVSYFAGEVLPKVRRRLHDATLDVIGPGFPHDLLSKLPPGVRVRGFVPDLPRALAGYNIYVAPLRLGGGTKLKVLTALAHGVPLVTTPVGAEGLHLEPGKHAAICRSSEEMARAVVRLHERPSEGLSMAQAGHQLVKERFAWERVRQETASWLARQMPQAPATSG